MALSWQDARRLIIDEVGALAPVQAEEAPLDAAAGRVLAADVVADRDQPPFDRSTRDGFAVRAADVARLPARLRVVGEIAAGTSFPGRIMEGCTAAIMTGAPLPAGADAVVMVEHTSPGADGTIEVGRSVGAGENVVPRGSELRAQALALGAGTRLDHAALALLASVGCARPLLRRVPKVAVLPTGDELVPVDARPGPAQIRDSNRYSLAAQIVRAGGHPVCLAPAADAEAPLREAILGGLALADMLVLSGGVSMGKHDLVEGVLASVGARVAFDAVAIRPGKPAVFALCGGRPVFGLPGNPLSTMVTFELLARPALELLGGARPTPVVFGRAPLAEALAARPVPLTVFLPAVWQGEGAGASVRVLPSQGSGDLGAAARATCFVVLPPGAGDQAPGSLVDVMAK